MVTAITRHAADAFRAELENVEAIDLVHLCIINVTGFAKMHI